MAPKKRRIAPPAKPGIARQLISDHFTSLPDDGIYRNGHILFMYMENERSAAQTIRAVEDRFGFKPRYSQIETLVAKSINKFKNLHRESEKGKLYEICQEVFQHESDTRLNRPITPVHPDSSLLPSGSDPEPFSLDILAPPTISSPDPTTMSLPTDAMITTPSQPVPSTSSQQSSHKHLRGDASTPRKLKLRRRLKFISESKVDLKKKYKINISELKNKIKTIKGSVKIKNLNQTIKRKESTIRILRQKLKEGHLAQKLAMKNEECKRWKRKYSQLKKSHEIKCVKVTASGDEDPFNLVNINKDEIIRNLENEKLQLEETLHELSSSTSQEKASKRDAKTYSVDTRMMVYDCIVNQVPTSNIPVLIANLTGRSGVKLTYIPHRNTVEQMARELGVISDLQAAEIALKTKNLTLGFDATTQEGVHINSIHYTTTTDCQVVAVDELPGGTAVDYGEHVCESVSEMARTYSDYHKVNYQDIHHKIIDNISNTMSDRVVVNHAAILQISANWNKTLNELNCHLHPLDTLASSCRSALKRIETEKGLLYGTDCMAGNVVLQMNKMRFKDGKGDPKGFKTFLSDHHLPKGILPRYRGNRLHILFHICGKLTEHYALFLKFLTTGTVSCGGLQKAIRNDFQHKTAKLEMQVLGLFGKLLTGPWMVKFYTSSSNQMDHITGINVIKDLVHHLKECNENPLTILTRATDFFYQPLNVDDPVLKQLTVCPPDDREISTMISACLSILITVLERQYKRYFDMDLTEELRKETETARSHNIDAEEIMGMFSAAQQRAPNATLCYLSSRMRAKKNRVVAYLDDLDAERRRNVVGWSVGMARRKRSKNRSKHAAMQQELSRRLALKQQKKQESERKTIERKLKIMNLEDIEKEFPELEGNSLANLKDIMSGEVAGRNICHVWYDTDSLEKTIYSGRIEKRKKNNTYVVSYWSEGETHEEDAVDYNMSTLELAADFICGDLVLS